ASEEVVEADVGSARAAEAAPAGLHQLDLVVLGALLVVVEHRVGLGDALEALLGVGVAVVVGVQLAGEFAVGPLGVLLGGILRHAEFGVEVLLQPFLRCHRMPPSTLIVCCGERTQESFSSLGSFAVSSPSSAASASASSDAVSPSDPPSSSEPAAAAPSASGSPGVSSTSSASGSSASGRSAGVGSSSGSS